MTILTGVEIAFFSDRVNCWLRFGDPDERIVLDRHRSLAFFKPGAIFTYVRWFANDYGTQRWTCYVVRAGTPGDALIRIPGVHPGGECLGIFNGAVLSKRFFEFVDAIEKQDIELSGLSEHYWRQAHLRLPLRWAPHNLNQDDINTERVRRKVIS